MSQQKFQIFRSQISDLKTDNVDYLKKPPWKKNFFDIFVIHLSSRYENRCRMLQRLFSLFQGYKNQLCFLIISKFFRWTKPLKTKMMKLRNSRLNLLCFKERHKKWYPTLEEILINLMNIHYVFMWLWFKNSENIMYLLRNIMLC